MFSSKQKIVTSASITAAIEATKAMAEVATGRKLVYHQIKIVAEPFPKNGLFDERSDRLVKTDIEFVSPLNARYTHAVVAWVTISRIGVQCVPTLELNFIKVDSNHPIRMKYSVPTTTWPLPSPIKAGEYEPTTMPKEWNPRVLDYSRIR